MVRVIPRITIDTVAKELTIKTSRSGGPGGQNVNKVETRVQVIFNIYQSKLLSDIDKEILKAKYANKLTKDGSLITISEAKRTQLGNKEIALKKMDQLLAKAFEKKKARKVTQPSKSAIQSRLKSKKIQSDKKANRKKLDF